MRARKEGVDIAGLGNGTALPSLAAAAHELKAPLTLIRQLALFLEENPASAEADQLLRQIALTTDRALRLTTDLSRSMRLDDSLFELEPLSPQQICEEVAHELMPLYRAKGRELRVTSRHRPILAVANRDLLRRVVCNFADNALHYAAVGTPVELGVAARLHGDKVRLAVRDYGPAVPTQLWKKIQANLGGAQPLHARPESSGLGLYVAGEFARAMQGAIGAVRHRDGATFYVDVTASRQLSLL